MRSRFTAFVRGDLDHIEYTHAPDEREKINRPTADSLDSSIEWIGLEIFGATLGGEKDDTGTSISRRDSGRTVSVGCTAKCRIFAVKPGGGFMSMENSTLIPVPDRRKK